MTNDTKNVLLCGWKEMILGSTLWLLTIPLQIWTPRHITLAVATIGTTLWLVGVVNICTMIVPIICTPPRDLKDNGDHNGDQSTYTSKPAQMTEERHLCGQVCQVSLQEKKTKKRGHSKTLK